MRRSGEAASLRGKLRDASGVRMRPRLESGERFAATSTRRAGRARHHSSAPSSHVRLDRLRPIATFHISAVCQFEKGPPCRDDSPFARWRPRADQQRNRPKPRSSSAASTRMSRGRSTSSASVTAHLTTIGRPLRSRCRPTTSARASNRSAPAVTTRRSRPSRVRAPMTPACESGRATGRWRVQPQRRGQALSDPRLPCRTEDQEARLQRSNCGSRVIRCS